MRDAIENVLYSYSWGFCHDDREMLAGCFSEHADVVFPNGHHALGRAAVLEELERRQGGIEHQRGGAWIVITNVLILERSAAEVRANSLFSSFHRTGSDIVIRSIGWYEDVFASEDDGEWRIIRRRVNARRADRPPAEES